MQGKYEFEPDRTPETALKCMPSPALRTGCRQRPRLDGFVLRQILISRIVEFMLLLGLLGDIAVGFNVMSVSPCGVFEGFATVVCADMRGLTGADS